MMKRQTQFRHYDRDQLLLLPPDMKAWLPEDDLAYFILDVVDRLNLRAIYRDYDGSQGGQPPYHPHMMVSLLLYGYCVGIPSSRKIEAATYHSIPFRVMTADQHPDHDTIAEFRHRHLKVLADLFVQVLQICQKAGLVKLGHVALDGTKVRANASKHKAMSYGRMEKTVQELEQEVHQLLQQAERIDADEDALYGQDKRGDELPRELRFKQSRLKKIQEAMASLESELKRKPNSAARKFASRKRLCRKRARNAGVKSPKNPRIPLMQKPSGTSPIPIRAS